MHALLRWKCLCASADWNQLFFNLFFNFILSSLEITEIQRNECPLQLPKLIVDEVFLCVKTRASPFKILPKLISGVPDNALCHLHMISQICCFFSHPLGPLISGVVSVSLAMSQCSQSCSLSPWPEGGRPLCLPGCLAGWLVAELVVEHWARQHRVGGVGAGRCSAPPGAASPSLLMLSGASQDQWLRQGVRFSFFLSFCRPHFVEDEIHIYPSPTRGQITAQRCAAEVGVERRLQRSPHQRGNSVNVTVGPKILKSW